VRLKKPEAEWPVATTQPSGSPQQSLLAARANAAKATDEYQKLADAALAKLADEPDYKAAIANADAIKKRLDAAREAGSDVSDISGQYLGAVANVVAMKFFALHEPAIKYARRKAVASTQAVAEIQAEIDRQAKSKNGSKSCTQPVAIGPTTRPGPNTSGADQK
jgi:hypothetical protein